MVAFLAEPSRVLATACAGQMRPLVFPPAAVDLTADLDGDTAADAQTYSFSVGDRTFEMQAPASWTPIAGGLLRTLEGYDRVGLFLDTGPDASDLAALDAAEPQERLRMLATQFGEGLTVEMDPPPGADDPRLDGWSVHGVIDGASDVLLRATSTELGVAVRVFAYPDELDAIVEGVLIPAVESIVEIPVESSPVDDAVMTTGESGGAADSGRSDEQGGVVARWSVPGRDNLEPRPCSRWLDTSEGLECWNLQLAQGGESDGSMRLPVTLARHSRSDLAAEPTLVVSLSPTVYDADSIDGFEDDAALVFFGPRGSSSSDTSMRCTELTVERRGAVEACVARLAASGLDVEQFTAPLIARDAKRLRQLLGVESWRVVLDGAMPVDSYALAQAFSSVDPDGTVAVAVRPERFSSMSPRESLAALHAAVADAIVGCEADEACARRYPDARQQLVDLLWGYDLELDAWVSPLDFTYRDQLSKLSPSAYLVVLGHGLADGLFPLLPAIAEEAAAGGGPLTFAVDRWSVFAPPLLQIDASCHAGGRIRLDARSEGVPELRFANRTRLDVEAFERDLCTSQRSVAAGVDVWSTSLGAASVPILVQSRSVGGWTIDPATRNDLERIGTTVVDVDASVGTVGECQRRIEAAFWRGDDIELFRDGACLRAGSGFWLGSSPPVENFVETDIEFEWLDRTVTVEVPEPWTGDAYGGLSFERRAHGLDPTRLEFDLWSETSVAEAVEWVAYDNGFEDVQQTLDSTKVVDGRRWTLAKWEDEAIAMTVASAEYSDGAVVVSLWGLPDESDGMIADVLMPALKLEVVARAETVGGG